MNFTWNLILLNLILLTRAACAYGSVKIFKLMPATEMDMHLYKIYGVIEDNLTFTSHINLKVEKLCCCYIVICI